MVQDLDLLSFYTYREANAGDKDWYVSLLLDRNNPLLDPDTAEARIYPRNASNYQYYQGLWMLVDESVLLVDIGGTLSTFANFLSGAYASYTITGVKVATETLAGFEGMISDIDITFTGKDDLVFLMEFNTNNNIIGGPDASISIQNKNISLKLGSQSVILVDGENETMTIQGGPLSILSALGNHLDMGGFNISNISAPSELNQVANKQYVDGFFDQIVAQMQWFNSTLQTDTPLTF